MATGIDLSTLSEALATVSSSLNSTDSSHRHQEEEYPRLQTPSRSQTAPHTTIDLKILLWNIHGDSSAGMADARRMLVQEVVRESNPDVLLLQEVEAQRTVTNFVAKCQPRRRYAHHRSAKHTEAYIVYDSQCFGLVSSIDLLGIIGDTKLLSAGAAPSTRTRGHTSPDQEYYDGRSCAIRLRHRGTGKELVLMSFHNASTRTAGRKPNIISYAKGFLTLVCMVHKHEGVPVIAGGDFNCDRSDLLAHARELHCELPDYAASGRRTSSEKIDLYVLKSSSSDLNSTVVEVLEVLPLTDPTSATAHPHPLGRDCIKYLVENAPVKRSTGEKLRRYDYTKTTNHDPTLSTVSEF